MMGRGSNTDGRRKQRGGADRRETATAKLLRKLRKGGPPTYNDDASELLRRVKRYRAGELRGEY